MAEVAIPLMALGSLYIMQNQKNKQESKCAETFTNMGKRQVPALPNTNTPPVNYPVPTNKSLASNRLFTLAKRSSLLSQSNLFNFGSR